MQSADQSDWWEDFAFGCANFPNVSIVDRELQLVRLGEPGYVYDTC